MVEHPTRSHNVALAAAIGVSAATAVATFLMLTLLTILTVDSLRGIAVG